ncbi:MAG: hypothetical protein KJ720_09545 [Proteobacteria bacterium]|nr:hypothetical protein [Pseudomonadota bacterium]MBU1450257.1 hypothetical protein [Pseudomonadota bacterium]MBU2469220.1 hypothetical protein [Pseudomonadota bacterium]MBU2519188.1 hypothetical protein [Pseudomonadota bacterium]
MSAAQPSKTTRLKPWEWWVLAIFLALTLGLALKGYYLREPHPVRVFLERAEVITQAARQFAADHGGAYPPDGIITRRPAGLTDRYIKWDDRWLIDFEAGPNGRGSHYVCLEFTGPRGRHAYRRLCINPEYRRRYGQGQPIPGHENRIWVIAEEARIYQPRKDKGR